MANKKYSNTAIPRARKIVKGMSMIRGAYTEGGSSKLSPLPPGFMKGPPSLIMCETSQKAIKFNIMVTTISLMLNFPFRNPAIAASPAPPRAAAINISGMRIPGERSALRDAFPPKANRTAKAPNAPK